MSKRLLAILLSLCLLVQCLPLSAHAADYEVNDTVTLENGTELTFRANPVTHTAILTSVTLPEGITELVIPTKVTINALTVAEKECAVTVINEGACSGRPVTKVVLPPTVTKLGSRAFLGCTSLSSINLENITEFGSRAFEGCSSLVEVTFSENLISLDNSGIFNGSGIKRVTLPASLKKVGTALQKCANLEEVRFLGEDTQLSSYSFYECSALKNISLPKKLKSIPECGFGKCTSLKSIQIPETVTLIGHQAFLHCESLTNVELPDGLTTLDGAVFQACYSLESITFPKGIKKLGSLIFASCRSLTSITIPATITDISGQAFDGCTALKSITFEGDDLTLSGNGLHFIGCTSLTEISLPKNLEVLPLKAFSGCKNLQTVELPDGLKTIENHAFNGCTALTNIILPGSLQTLGEACFYGCEGLRSISIPLQVKTIPFQAFSACRLKEITVNNPETKFENNSISVYSDLTIKGYSGSPAQTFANERNCKFVPLDVVEEGKTLTLTVHDPEGNAVAEGYRIQWLNESGEVVWANARYPNAQNGTYRVKVILEEELAWEYQEPGEQSVTVNGADATVEVALTKRPTAAVTGKVVDNKGKPIDGAGITAARADGGPDVTGTSGADGTFSLTVTQGTDITLTVKKQGYYTRSQLIEALTADVSLGDIAMNPAAPGNRIAIAMELVPAAKEGSSSINTPPVSYEGFAFTVKKADGSTVIAEIQGTQLILTPGQAAPGDVLTVSASDPSGNYADSEPVTVSLTQNATGSAVITLTELGGVNLGDVQSQKPASVMVFDSTGKWVRTASAVKDTTIKPLPAGSYTLVFIEDNDLLRSVPSIAYLSELGLTEGTAYVSKSVAVRNGKIEVLGTVTVPRLNEEQLSIISTSSVSLTQPGDLVAGTKFYLRVSYELKPNAPAGSQTIEAVLPQGIEPADSRTAMIDGANASYTYDSASRVVSLIIPGDKDKATAYFYLTTNQVHEPGEKNINVSLRSGSRTTPVGSAALNLSNISIRAPEKTGMKTLPVSGKAAPEATVNITLNGKSAATAKANKAGTWSTSVKLLEESDLRSWAEFTLIAKDQYGNTSAPLNITYKNDLPSLEKLTFFYNNGTKSTVIDFKADGTYSAPKSYSLWRGDSHTFTFKAEFNEKPEAAYIVSTASDGSTTNIPLAYSDKNHAWVGSYTYPVKKVPANISVAYSYKEKPYEDQPEEVKAADIEVMEAETGALVDEYVGYSDLQYEVTVNTTDKLHMIGYSNINDQKTPVNEVDISNMSTSDIEALDDVTISKLSFLNEKVEGIDIRYSSYVTGNKIVTIQQSAASPDQDWTRIEYDLNHSIEYEETVSASENAGEMIGARKFNAGLNSREFDSLSFWYTASGLVPVFGLGIQPVLGSSYIGKLYRQLNVAEAQWFDYYTEFLDELNAKCPNGQPKYNEYVRVTLDQALKRADEDISSKIAAARERIKSFHIQVGLDLFTSTATAFSPINMPDFKTPLKDAFVPSIKNISANIASDALNYGEGKLYGMIGDLANPGQANAATRAAIDLIPERIAHLNSLLQEGQNCEPTPTPEPSPDSQSPAVPVRAVHDPSGYVYEAVPSNRLEGVTAKILENSGGVWNAGEFDQANPLTTDADGTYHWDVPEGSWKVEFTKAGYTTTNTEEAAKARGYTDGWLEVPPAQLEVNVAMMSTTAPTVSNSVAYTNCVEVEFSQYMDIDSTKSAITIEPDLGTITVEPIDSEDNGSGTKYAKRFRITPAAGSVPTEGVKIKVSAEAKNYSGTALCSAYTSTMIKPEIRPTSLEASSTGILINRETTLPVTINPSIEGLDIQVENLAPGILSTTETTLKTDAAGKVFIIVTGNLPGVGRLRITEPKSGISRELEISISSSTRPEKITVTRQDGLGVTGSTTVPKGTVITLSTTTAGAAIRYTLNDTCPCTKEALYYTEPIIINSTTILRAAALIDGQYSETINYTLTVSGGSSSGGGYYPSPTYKVTLPENTAHGTVKANSAFGHNGDTITLTVTPDKGWTLDSLTVLDSAGNDLKLTAVSDNKYTFTMPAGDVKVSATFRKVNDPKPPVWKNPFPDVNDNKWYIEAIEFVCTNGLMAGYSNGKFGPDDIITRAQFAQIIYNKEGKPEGGSSVFTDVTTGWYAAAVNWAASKDIVAGIGGGKFAPGQSITRQDLATMLWRYAGSPEPKKNELNFSDAGQVSKYAWKALCWATENGIVNGKGNGTLDPKGKATRAEAAQMLMNYIKKQPKIRK